MCTCVWVSVHLHVCLHVETWGWGPECSSLSIGLIELVSLSWIQKFLVWLPQIAHLLWGIFKYQNYRCATLPTQQLCGFSRSNPHTCTASLLTTETLLQLQIFLFSRTLDSPEFSLLKVLILFNMCVKSFGFFLLFSKIRWYVTLLFRNEIEWIKRQKVQTPLLWPERSLMSFCRKDGRNIDMNRIKCFHFLEWS